MNTLHYNISPTTVSMKIIKRKITLVYFVLLFSCPAAICQFLTNSQIDAVAKELSKSVSFKEGGHEGMLGSFISKHINMDWPIKNKDVRATWDIDPTQDTDGDGTPDVDDEDIDGDGIPNTKDPDIDGDGIDNFDDDNPYDSTKSFMAPNGGSPETDGSDGDGKGDTFDSDGDGIPDIFDTFPKNPTRSFRNPQLENNKKHFINALFVNQTY